MIILALPFVGSSLALLSKAKKTVATDVVEIGQTMFTEFIAVLKPGETDSSHSDSSDTDFWDPETFGCGEITKPVEKFVSDSYRDCIPVEETVGSNTGKLVKNVLRTTNEKTEETMCVAMKATLNAEIVSEIELNLDTNLDPELRATCIQVCYWFCCNAINKVSSVIAEAMVEVFESYKFFYSLKDFSYYPEFNRIRLKIGNKRILLISNEDLLELSRYKAKIEAQLQFDRKKDSFFLIHQYQTR